MGLLLLTLRVSVIESGMFLAQQQQNNNAGDGAGGAGGAAGAHVYLPSELPKGDLTMLFKPRERLLKYIRCVLVGIPNWYVIGILGSFSPELSHALGTTGEVQVGTTILVMYLGLSLGDAMCGFLSQFLRSRKRPILIFILATAFMSYVYLLNEGSTTSSFYVVVFFLGISNGYWVTVCTACAEQFGINMRNTVATTVPNMIRGSAILSTQSFRILHKGGMDLRYGDSLHCKDT